MGTFLCDRGVPLVQRQRTGGALVRRGSGAIRFQNGGDPMRLAGLSLALLALPAGLSGGGAEDTPVPKGAKLEKLWGEGEFTEGPAYGPGGCVYFSDIGDRIMKFDPATGKTTEFRK